MTNILTKGKNNEIEEVLTKESFNNTDNDLKILLKNGYLKNKYKKNDTLTIYLLHYMIFHIQ